MGVIHECGGKMHMQERDWESGRALRARDLRRLSLLFTLCLSSCFSWRHFLVCRHFRVFPLIWKSSAPCSSCLLLVLLSCPPLARDASAVCTLCVRHLSESDFMATSLQVSLRRLQKLRRGRQSEAHPVSQVPHPRQDAFSGRG